jgi:hypothetical protein
VSLRHKTDNGARYDAGLQRNLARNQSDLVDELTTPHVRLPENLGAKHTIVSKVPAYTPDSQPVQARGRICWNKAYEFQPRGPSYLDPTPDSGGGS